MFISQEVIIYEPISIAWHDISGIKWMRWYQIIAIVCVGVGVGVRVGVRVRVFDSKEKNDSLGQIFIKIHEI